MKSLTYALISLLSIPIRLLSVTATVVIVPAHAEVVQPIHIVVQPPQPALDGVLERIAACESTGRVTGIPRQFNADGSPLWGNDPATGKPIERDVGILQINTWAHAAELKATNLDVIHSEADNIAFGKYLYAKYGTAPWAASESCWKA